MRERYAKIEKCPSCGSGSFWKYIRTFGPDFVTEDGFNASYSTDYDQCIVCGLVFQNPMPDMSDFYSSGKYRESVISSDEIDKNRAKEIVGLINEFGLSPLELLDFGCGRGFLLDAANDILDIPVMGVEPDLLYPQTEQPVYASLEDISTKFTLITAIHVLEHMSDPVGTLKKLGEYLWEGGTILVQVPIAVPGGISPLRMAHAVSFTVPSLNYAATVAGFELGHVRVDNNLTVTMKRSK